MKKEKVILIKRHVGEDNISYIKNLISLYVPKYVENDSSKTKLSKNERVNDPLTAQIQKFFKMAYMPNS